MTLNGFLCVNKPCGPSSFTIISQIRRLLCIKKAGHCGTLDPQATGLLVLALGSSTRLLQYLDFEPKCYDFGIQFGSETDSYDSEGTIIANGGSFPAEEILLQSLLPFKGKIQQVPPGFSAIKVNGVRAYTLARNGEIPTLPPRPVTIFDLKMNSYDKEKGYAEFTLSCSSGTYVRSLIRDISHACSTFGTSVFIKRISAGRFTLDQAVTIGSDVDLKQYIISPGSVFKKEDCVEIDDIQFEKIKHGQTITFSNQTSIPPLVFALRNGIIVAVLKSKSSSEYHPETVLATGVL